MILQPDKVKSTPMLLSYLCFPRLDVPLKKSEGYRAIDTLDLI